VAKDQAPSRLCNRTACRQPNATWWNLSTRAWYCQKCSLKINELNGEQVCIPTVGLCEVCCQPILYGVDLCQIEDGKDIITLDQLCWRKLGEPLTAKKYREAAEVYFTQLTKLPNSERYCSDWDHRVITGVSLALGGMVGLADDVDRLMQQIVRGHSTDKMKTAVEIAVAFIRFSQDLKRKNYADEVIRLQKVVCDMTEKIIKLGGEV
jgi:hypothetical protein